MGKVTGTIQLSAETMERLAKLAAETGRELSELADQALFAFAHAELEDIEGIRRGMADAKAGRLVSHEDAMARLDATIAAAIRRRA